ncbi:helix-turn-helix transcriptional regulator [Rhodococcus qingshengii]|uniref:helix-turn-helix transcriptional regulator n=1 Tax=Rhodococcus qingshengii TaxID=334542 RepID=UPI0036D7F697
MYIDLTRWNRAKQTQNGYIPNMANPSRVEDQFRKRIKLERTVRRWSQDDLAKRLVARGVAAHPTTIAKIEAGTRTIKLDEAVEIAALFDISLDELSGRGDIADDLKRATQTLSDTAVNAYNDLVRLTESIVDAYEFLRQQLDFKGMETGIAEGRIFETAGLSLEHRRALMAWVAQDKLRQSLQEASLSLHSVVWAHYATPMQLRDSWDRIIAQVEQMQKEAPDDPLRLNKRIVFKHEGADGASLDETP